MKVWNSGKATAYNVDFSLPEECKTVIFKDKVPYEVLESGKSFEEHAMINLSSSHKFKVTTNWDDEQGISHSKENILSI